jgi:hypothetical protein
LTEVGANYFLDNTGSGTGPELRYNGAAVAAGQFGTSTPIGAVQVTGGGYDVAWHDTGSGQYTVWSVDSNGNYLSNLIGAVSGSSTTLESLETTFNQDLNGDGVIGIYAAPGTTLQISSPLSGVSGSTTVGAGGTLELASADSASVTFNSSTGMLRLDSPSTFSGLINNFAGNGTPSGSDQIDLKGINFNSVHDTYSNGVLTVTDGTNSAALDFNGSYTLANFKFASDSGGGTVVYDPPVSGQPDFLEPTSQTGGGCPLNFSVARGEDSFIFNPALGDAVVANANLTVDTGQSSPALFANIAATMLHEDGLGHAAVADATHNTNGNDYLAPVELLAHQTDFHLL